MCSTFMTSNTLRLQGHLWGKSVGVMAMTNKTFSEIPKEDQVAATIDLSKKVERAIGLPFFWSGMSVARKLGATALLRHQFEQFFDRSVRPDYFKKMDFTAPAGDQGWFGPDSAVWYVHSNLPVLEIGLFTASHIENLHPGIAWMGYDHSRVVQREDGVPTGRIDQDGARVRFAHSLAFFLAVAIGPTETAERAARAVRAMHHTVKGTRPDGIPYDADDEHFLRWNYATVVWGIAAAHERYHPKPLDDIDDYYREFVRVGEALGGTNLPETKAEVLEYLAGDAAVMGLTLPGAATGFATARDVVGPLERPILKFLDWAKCDLLPRWAQNMYSFVPPNAAVTTLRRAQLRALLDALDATPGPLREVKQSYKRAKAKPDLKASTEPNLASVRKLQAEKPEDLSRSEVEAAVN